MKNNWMSLCALIFSAIALIITFLRIDVTISNDTFIGVIASFIGVAVTMIVGWQIFSYIQTKNEIDKIHANVDFFIREIQEKNEDIDKKLKDFEKIAKAALAPLFFNEALLCKSNNNLLGACEYFVKCIDYALYENWETIIDPTLNNLSHILSSDTSLEVSSDVIIELKKNPNYFVIKKRFEEIIQKRNNKDDSSNEI